MKLNLVDKIGDIFASVSVVGSRDGIRYDIVIDQILYG